MRSTGEEVRERIISAARTEFAAHGIAGARIDRIATNAHASKERLYAHFGDKLALFRFVLDTDSESFFAPITATPEDLPGFVGTMFDRSQDHVEHLRMFGWARMAGEPFRTAHAIETVDRLRNVAEEAQRIGAVDTQWDPEEVVSLMFTLAFAWLQTPELRTGVYGRRHSSHERMIAVEAARRLLEPRGRSGT
ncbi:TetR family transcriptional regulator [Microbacterium sp. LRZ72]|uniref:TetR family transcriptional regulator n=1 Tax=Microbacterium sp. LRZ72 TaxID=2942481 RepID=UPI0029B26554|nr:TetR family transcriptional regulator [Microbacterium sp. LRZ72]MDX2377541.1 TetR family transcriptional regulator [Microbacterium sp. LRZ72]